MAGDLETLEGDVEVIARFEDDAGTVEGDRDALLAGAFQLGDFQNFVAVNGLDGGAVSSDFAPLGGRGNDHASLTESSAFSATFKILIEKHCGRIGHRGGGDQDHREGKKEFLHG